MWSEHCSYKNTRPLLKGFPTEKRRRDGEVRAGAGQGGRGERGHHRHGRRLGDRVQDRVAQPSERRRAVRGRGHGRGRDHPRHLHDGGAAGPAHQFAAVRRPGLAGDQAAPARGRGRASRTTATASACRRSAATSISTAATRATRSSTRSASASCGTTRSAAARPRASAIPVYYVGAATGRDGLGGASFASKELSAESSADRPAVQKGDPFMEKLLIEACLEMMAVPGLVVGIQDMGAAGLTCSTCETASRGGAGIEIELDRVPQRETGMNSYEIMLSESQERMLVIVQQRPRTGDRGDLREVGPARRACRRRDRHRPHGRQAARRRGGRHPGGSPSPTGAPVYQREAREPAYLAGDLAPGRRQRACADLDAGGVQAGACRGSWRIRPSPRSAGSTASTTTWCSTARSSCRAAMPRSSACGSGAREKFIAISNDCNGRYCYLNPAPRGADRHGRVPAQPRLLRAPCRSR